MKKVIISILLTIFMILPMSIKADTSCVYHPTLDLNGVKYDYGEYTITRTSSGSYTVNGVTLNARGNSTALGNDYNATPVYFAGKDAKLMYDSLSPKVWNVIDNRCQTFSKDSCPSNTDDLATFYKFNCEPKISKCRIAGKELIGPDIDKKEELIPRGNVEVLKKVFTGDTCPTLNIIFDYSTDAKKYYMILLGDMETKDQMFVTKTPGTLTQSVAEQEIKINVAYYAEGSKIDHNYFSSVVYNKSTGYLKFKMIDHYGAKSFSLLASDGTSYTQKVDNVVNFLNVDYDYLQFIVYGDLKSKLDNWTSSDYLYLMFSDGQMGTLTHYLMANSSDVINFCENTWGYEYNDCKKILDKARDKAEAEFNGNGELNKFDVQMVPLCADNSHALIVFKIIGYVLVVLKILVPVALIIYGTISFYKVIIGNNQDDLSLAIKALIQRAILALLIFLTPTVVYYFMSLIGNAVSKDDAYFKNCNTCLLKPDDCPARNTYEDAK